MARIPNRTKLSSRREALASRQAALVKTHSLRVESQLGLAILVEVLSAAAQVLRTNRDRIRQVRSSDQVKTPRSADVSSAEIRSGVEAIYGVAAGAGTSFHQPAANPIKLVGGGAEGGQAKMGRITRNQMAPEGVHLYNLRQTSCRWPLGPFLQHSERFCGAPRAPGCPYCPEHRERAFSRPEKRAPASNGTHKPVVVPTYFIAHRRLST